MKKNTLFKKLKVNTYDLLFPTETYLLKTQLL